jgi:hypothetical protein
VIYVAAARLAPFTVGEGQTSAAFVKATPKAFASGRRAKLTSRYPFVRRFQLETCIENQEAVDLIAIRLTNEFKTLRIPHFAHHVDF